MKQMKDGTTGDVSMYGSGASSNEDTHTTTTHNTNVGVLASAYPSTYYYREVQVCARCVKVNTGMDQRRERAQRKNSGKHRSGGGARGAWQRRLERQRERVSREAVTRKAKRRGDNAVVVVGGGGSGGGARTCSVGTSERQNSAVCFS